MIVHESGEDEVTLEPRAKSGNIAYVGRGRRRCRSKNLKDTYSQLKGSAKLTLGSLVAYAPVRRMKACT